LLKASLIVISLALFCSPGKSVAREEAAVEILPVLSDPRIFESSPEALKGPFKGLKIGWASSDKRTLRSTDPNMRLAGQRVYELQIDVENDRISRVRASVFNRGDAKEELSFAEFNSLRQLISDALTDSLGTSPRESSSDRGQKRNSAHEWKNKSHLAELMAGLTPDQTAAGGTRPEFLNLNLQPAAGSFLNKKASERISALTVSRLRDNVQRRENGDVVIESVPMVDQGPKGYCAVASTERVMRYFGMDVDQHQLAQAAMTASKGGTDPESLRKALHSIAGRTGLKLQSIEDWDQRSFRRFLEKYNRQAKKSGEKEISLRGRGTVTLTAVYSWMDLETLAATRKPTLSSALTKIKDRIDDGFPVMWSLMLGLAKEDPAIPQARGGHMRLIIGYNDQTGEFLYTDSWGRGHELKRMPYEQAWAVTTGALALTPQ